MIRRKFLQRLAGAGAAGLVPAVVGCSHQQMVANFAVKGFTCITCATGLETLLGRQRGVVAVVAAYPQGLARVTFDPAVTSADVLASSIREMGFGAALLSETAARDPGQKHRA